MVLGIKDTESTVVPEGDSEAEILDIGIIYLSGDTIAFTFSSPGVVCRINRPED